ncbi:hypothetical protein Tco_1457867 [Tanacetum coccineum]
MAYKGPIYTKLKNILGGVLLSLCFLCERESSINLGPSNHLCASFDQSWPLIIATQSFPNDCFWIANTIDWSDPAMLRYHALQNRPYSVAEVRKNMVMYLKNQAGYKQKDKKKDSEKKGSRKKSLARKRAGEKQSEESTKRQKIEDDVEKEELKAYLDLVPREEFAMEIESLATKADGSFKNYKIFSEMLDDFDRQNVLDLHRLVKASDEQWNCHSHADREEVSTYSRNAIKDVKQKTKAKVGKVAYRLELPQDLSRVHHTFHVSNLKKCYADEPLAMPLEVIYVDDKLQFVEEPIEIMEREIKRIKKSRIPLVKVRWNSRRGPEFTWEREDSFKQKYPQLFTNRASSSTTRS